MNADFFAKLLGTDFYSGVPDSLLRPFCDYLMERYSLEPKHHVIAANEGNAVALAAGYYMATGKIPAVYMQNSGEGNIVNPLLSLAKIYKIPVIFIIGWRGESGVHDEPQHKYQGEVTLPLLDAVGVPHFVIEKGMENVEVEQAMHSFEENLSQGNSVAFVVKKSAIEFERKMKYKNGFIMKREDILRYILEFAGDDIIVSTTGKTSRELFELREAAGDGHEHDFLTVGSMGHSSSIALGIAAQRSEKKIWCIDGDGAALMHMGAMAVVGAYRPKNFTHIIINNGAHESVGGMPTVMGKVNIPEIARGCGYEYAVSIEDEEALRRELQAAKRKSALSLLEIKSAIGSRADLGRPTTTPEENIKQFMDFVGR